MLLRQKCMETAQCRDIDSFVTKRKRKVGLFKPIRSACLYNGLNESMY